MKKFRSYREGLNKFCYFKDGKYYSDEACEREITYNIDVHFDWANAKSFTGLTDKNGTDIYEGDRVRHKFKRAWKTEYHESKVYWNQVWCCFYLFDGTSDYRMRDDIEYEVIGNVFEDDTPHV